VSDFFSILTFSYKEHTYLLHQKS